MKVAMLLVSILFLATAVEALPGGGGRQLAWDPRAGKKCKKSKVDVCWKQCKKLDAKPTSIVSFLNLAEPKCTITWMETCLGKIGGCGGVAEKNKKKCCKKQCKKQCKKKSAECKSCKKSCMDMATPSSD